MPSVNAFTPLNNTAVVAATVASGRVSLGTGGGMSVRVYNAGTTLAHIKFGDDTVAATTDDLYVPPGSIEVFSINLEHTHAAAIMASGTANIYFIRGEGA